MITDEELDALEKLEREATAGPVTITDTGVYGAFGPRWSIEGQKVLPSAAKPYAWWPVIAQCHLKADADHFAAARNALPELLRRVRAAERLAEVASDVCNGNTSDPIMKLRAALAVYRGAK